MSQGKYHLARRAGLQAGVILCLNTATFVKLACFNHQCFEIRRNFPNNGFPRSILLKWLIDGDYFSKYHFTSAGRSK